MKPSDPRRLRMPSAEDGIRNAQDFVDRWVTYEDVHALNFFYNSLQEQIKIFYNLQEPVKSERVEWVLECEKMIARARDAIHQS